MLISWLKFLNERSFVIWSLRSSWSTEELEERDRAGLHGRAAGRSQKKRREGKSRLAGFHIYTGVGGVPHGFTIFPYPPTPFWLGFDRDFPTPLPPMVLQKGSAFFFSNFQKTVMTVMTPFPFSSLYRNLFLSWMGSFDEESRCQHFPLLCVVIQAKMSSLGRKETSWKLEKRTKVSFSSWKGKFIKRKKKCLRNEPFSQEHRRPFFPTSAEPLFLS